MKLILLSLTAAIFFASCNNTANQGGNSGGYTNMDSNALSKSPTDTYKTNVETSTSGPDNAPPNPGDSNQYHVNKATKYNNTGTNASPAKSQSQVDTKAGK